jgi:long-chain fatty acid transport protein
MLAHASGFRLPESSVSGMSLTNAVVANTEMTGATIYNPALMSAHEERRSLSLGLMNVRLDIHVDPDNGTATDSQGKDSIFIPGFYYTSRISSRWSWGVGMDAPFGLETKWPSGTFATFSNVTVPFLEPEASRLEVLNITPNASYRIDANNSVAFGVNYYDVRQLKFNTQSIQINGDGSDFGFTLAYLYTRGPWSLGATYRTSVKADLDGTIHDDGTFGGLTRSASATIEFPSMFQIGLRNQINQQLAVEFDIERTNWSSFDVIEISHGNTNIPSNPITNANNWEDVTAYRLGATYQLNSQLQLRFGYSLDNTPQTDKYYSARIPDADRQLLSFGAGYKQNDWEFEGGLMLVMFDDRTVNRPANSYASNVGSGNFDPNGTDAYNGKYESSALILGVGFTKTFDY